MVTVSGAVRGYHGISAEVSSVDDRMHVQALSYDQTKVTQLKKKKQVVSWFSIYPFVYADVAQDLQRQLQKLKHNKVAACCLISLMFV